MRASYVVVLAVVSIMASFGEISATTDKSELLKVNRGMATPSIESGHDTRSRFLRQHKITDDTGNEERAITTGTSTSVSDELLKAAEKFASKLTGQKAVFESVKDMPVLVAWQHLQQYTGVKWETRLDLLTLLKLPLDERQLVLGLIKNA